MRKLLAACACVATLAAPSAAPAQESEGWSYAYIEGVATATQRDDRGRVTATLTCRPPEGDIVLRDYTLVRRARGSNTAAVRIGAMQVNVPMQVEGRRAAGGPPLRDDRQRHAHLPGGRTGEDEGSRLRLLGQLRFL